MIWPFFFKLKSRTCSSNGNRTRTPYFWLQMIEHHTSNIVRPTTMFKAVSLLDV